MHIQIFNVYVCTHLIYIYIWNQWRVKPARCSSIWWDTGSDAGPNVEPTPEVGTASPVRQLMVGNQHFDKKYQYHSILAKTYPWSSSAEKLSCLGIMGSSEVKEVLLQDFLPSGVTFVDDVPCGRGRLSPSPQSFDASLRRRSAASSTRWATFGQCGCQPLIYIIYCVYTYIYILGATLVRT